MFLNLDNFDPGQIADSGQCFRWHKVNDQIYIVPAFGKYLIIKKCQDGYEFSCDENEWNSIWSSYFDNARDYNKIKKVILSGKDKHLKDAYSKGSGVRILKQDLWEIIFSFMISQNNNIKRIKGSIEKVCQYCKLDRFDNSSLSELNLDKDEISLATDIYRFPSYDEIPLEIFDDSSFGFGYRAPYLKGLCQYVSDNPDWLDYLKTLSYEDAMTELLKIKGIGKKVANCICLFGLGHVNAFPIDTHVRQLLDKYYPDGFDYKKYDGYAGIIQQYLFYFELQ